MISHPEFKCVLHYSGILLEWFEHNEREMLSLIFKLIERNQVELLSGGYYEPIMSDIMEEDRISQVKKLSEFLNRLFGIIPEGLWLAERVWEENYPLFINKTGIKYTILDDFHFKAAGFARDELNGYYITEDINNPLYVFPIDMKLRYMIPFCDIEEIIVYLEKMYDMYDNPVIVFMDDGEKLGEWPGTFDTVYKNKWLSKLAARIAEKSDIFELTTFSEVLKKYKPTGRAYIPANSYRELVEWSLPSKKYEKYLKLKTDLEKIGIFTEMENFFKPDGYWRNFFVKYPESNLMHKRMINERRRLIAAKEFVKESSDRDCDDLLETAHEYLMKSQCSCAYWHGKFGGIYYPHLRDEVYSNIINASKIIDEIEFGNTNFLEITQTDFDCDGKKEIFVDSNSQNLIFKPETGGRLVIWELKELDFNILNSVSRKREAYHNDIFSNHPEISSQLFFDWHLKDSFIDHFFHPKTRIEDFYRNKFGEQGDFIIEPFKLRSYVTKNLLELTMHRSGNVWIDNDNKPVNVEKKFIFDKKDRNPKIKSKYYISNNGKNEISIDFGIELNFFFRSVPFVKSGDLIQDVNHSFEIDNCSDLTIYESKRDFELSIVTENPITCWALPVYTIICSRTGYEKIFQGITIVLKRNVTLIPDETVKIYFDMSVKYNNKEDL